MKPVRDIDWSKKKAVIFDLDGTLVDSAGVWDEIDQMTIKHFSGQTIDLKTINKDREHFLTNNPSGHIYLNYSKWLCEKYDIKDTAEDVLRMRWDTGCLWYKTCDYKDHADKVINKFLEMDLVLAIATSGVREQVDKAQFTNDLLKSKADFSHVFKEIVTQEDINKKKPDPEIYLETMRRLNVNANQCIVFEDHLNGVKSAKSAGIEVVNIYCPHSDYDREELDKISDYLMKDWKELYDTLT